MSLDVSCVQPNWTKNMGVYIKWLLLLPWTQGNHLYFM
jgi:hypothetical protein